METYTELVVKRMDGVMVNVHFQPVETIRRALRFKHEEDFQHFIQGHYKPDNPEDYYVQEIKVTYEVTE